MPMREPPQPPQPGLEQRLRAAHVPAPVMVKGRGYLNDSLQKGFIRFRRSQPNLFPSLMRIKKQAILLKKSVPEPIFLERLGAAVLSGRFRRNADDDGPAATYRAAV